MAIVLHSWLENYVVVFLAYQVVYTPSGVYPLEYRTLYYLGVNFVTLNPLITIPWECYGTECNLSRRFEILVAAIETISTV